ncbi:hypothetical protein TNCV_1205291 [Trichonephila clavipes]|nr:hypothetical protein TNCV_1205291 [Trichonephila clavipes]
MKRRAETHNIDDSLLLNPFTKPMPVAKTIWHPYLRLPDKASEVADRILLFPARNQRCFCAEQALISDWIVVLQPTCFWMSESLRKEAAVLFVDLVVNFGTTTTFV